MIQRHVGDSVVAVPAQTPFEQVPVPPTTQEPIAPPQGRPFETGSAWQCTSSSQTPSAHSLSKDEQSGGVPLTQLPDPLQVSAPSQNVKSAQLVPPVTY